MYNKIEAIAKYLNCDPKLIEKVHETMYNVPYNFEDIFGPDYMYWHIYTEDERIKQLAWELEDYIDNNGYDFEYDALSYMKLTQLDEFFEEYVDDLEDRAYYIDTYANSFDWFENEIGFNMLSYYSRIYNLDFDYMKLARDIINDGYAGDFLAEYDKKEVNLGGGLYAYREL